MQATMIDRDNKPSNEMKQAEFLSVDSLGRKLVLKRPSVLAETRFPLILGDEKSSNKMYYTIVMPLLFLVEFDGEKIAPFTSFSDVEYLLQKLGNEGLEELTLTCLEHFSEMPRPEVAARIKKLSEMKS